MEGFSFSLLSAMAARITQIACHTKRGRGIEKDVKDERAKTGRRRAGQKLLRTSTSKAAAASTAGVEGEGSSSLLPLLVPPLEQTLRHTLGSQAVTSF